MNSIKYYICIILSFASIQTLFGQLPEQYKNIQSPNAASLGQYGNIPVSYFTGTPNIEIPLYESSVNGENIPISLSYHIAGIRPDQRSGWVGMGWTLNCGGCISRNLRGSYDEENTWNSSLNKYIPTGYLYLGFQLESTEWNTEKELNNLVRNGTGMYDTEPDEFSFNFLGYSGMFILNTKGEWIVKSEDNIKVLKTETASVPFRKNGQCNDVSKVISGFVLQDSKGIKYTFGVDLNAVEFSINFYNQDGDFWHSSSWFLSKIEFPENNSLKLEYERGLFTNQMWYSVFNYEIAAYDPFFFRLYPEGKKVWNSRLRDQAEGSLISPVFLKSVIFPHGRMNFHSTDSKQLEYGTDIYQYHIQANESTFNSIYKYISQGLYEDWESYDFNNHTPDDLTTRLIFEKRLKSRQLDSIIVYNNDNSKLKAITMRYSKNKTNRLFLEKVAINNASYQFEYNTPDSVPVYLTEKTDHWGYYNGKFSPIIKDTIAYYNSKEPNPEKMGYGILKCIVYPTGGFTKFEYEPNVCNWVLNPNRTDLIRKPLLAGGLRIKEIASGNSSNNIIEKKEIYYTENFRNLTSSGILGGLPKYYYYNFELKSKDGLSGHLYVNCSSNSVNYGGMNACGSQIGYSNVIEELSDGSRYEYHYSNFDTNLDEPAGALFQGTKTASTKYTSKESERGLLLQKKHYNKAGELSLRESYQFSNGQMDYVPSIYIKSYPDIPMNLIEAAAYKVYTYIPKVSKIHTSEYFGNDSLVYEKNISYNSFRQPSIITKSKGCGEIEKSRISYLWESDKTAKDKFILFPESEHKLSVIDNSGNESVRSILNKNYKKINDLLYVPVMISSRTVGFSDSDTLKCEYDNYGNLIYEEKAGSKGTVYLWGYSSQNLIAKVENADIRSVRNIIGKFEEFVESDRPNYAKIAKIRESLPSASVTSYTYCPGIGLSSITYPNGISEYYKYDTFGRLESIIDNNGNIIKAYKYNYRH